MTQSTAGVPLQQTVTPSKSKAFTITAHVARVILGLIFFVLGLNKFLHFIPTPPPTGSAGEFMFGLTKAAYFFPFLAITEVFSGALLLSGTLVPLALLLLSPIIINIFLYHLSLAPEGLGMAIFIIAAEILLAVYYWPAYKAIFNTQNAWKSKRS